MTSPWITRTGRPTSLHASAFLVLTLITGCVRGPQKANETPAQKLQQIDQLIALADYDAARTLAKQSFLSDRDSEWGWRFKLQYALTLLYVDDLKEAAPLLETPLPGNLSALQPRYDYVTAYLHFREHDPKTQLLLQAVVTEAREQKDAVTEIDSLLLLARYGSTEEALSLQQRALAVARQHQLAFYEAAALAELGSKLSDVGRYTDAIPYYLQTIFESRKIKARYMEVLALDSLGTCYYSLGDFDKALSSLKQARPLLRVTDPPGLRIEVSMHLGQLFSLRQQNDEALSYFREAFAMATPHPDLRSYVPTAENLSAALLEAHAPLDEAEKYNELARKVLSRDQAGEPALAAAAELNRADIAAGRGDLPASEALYNKALQLLAGNPPNAIQWSAFARLAKVDERLGKSGQARKNYEKALDSIESNRSRQISAQYQITFLSALIRFYQEYVDFLIRQNRMDDALAVADSSRASVLAEGSISSRAQPNFMPRVRHTARTSQSALLFYWLAPAASYVWIVTPAGSEFQKLSLSQEKIEQDVNSYSAFIQNAREDTRASANPVGMRLYETLIGPVAAYLKPGMRVVVVPDGALHGLNFETLLVGSARAADARRQTERNSRAASGGEPDTAAVLRVPLKSEKPHYWLEDANVTVAPSLGILLRESKSHAANGKTLLIGDPIYTGSEYPALPESKTEIAQVAARFPKDLTVLTQARAVPQAFKKAGPELFSRIHFSAHVDADPQSPLDSAIILSPGEDGSRKLSARDVMNSRLSADLVTVSGCNSVGKKVLSGEGMVGFAWAAFDAGAHNAVTSLWEVDDRSTTELMNLFYAGVTSGKPYASALRTAKLQLLASGSAFQKPFYWAPFQLYSRSLGSGESVTLH